MLQPLMYVEKLIASKASKEIKAYRYLRSAIKLASEKYAVSEKVIYRLFDKAIDEFNKGKNSLKKERRSNLEGQLLSKVADNYEIPRLVLNSEMVHRSLTARKIAFVDEDILAPTKISVIKTVIKKGQTDFFHK